MISIHSSFCLIKEKCNFYTYYFSSEKDTDSLQNLISSHNEGNNQVALSEHKNLCAGQWDQNKKWLTVLKKLLKWLANKSSKLFFIEFCLFLEHFDSL